MSLIDDKMALLDDIETELLGHVDYLNGEVLKAVNRRLLDFEIKGGKFAESADAPVVVAQLKKEIRGIIDGAEFRGKFDAWIKNYDQIVTMNQKIQKQVNKLNLTKAEFSDIKKASIDNVIDRLVGAGVDANFINPLTEGLMRNVLLGASVAETKDYLEAYVVGDDEVAGKLSTYAGQLARDSVSQFDGQLNQTIFNDNEMDGFAYVGSVVRDSRPFCVHLIEDMKGFISSADLSKVLKKYLGSEKLGRGMIGHRTGEPQTTADNFAVYRGGWNCRHAAIPVFKENLKKAI